ncbi:MAG: SRPBCC domain-containing protein [Williamsia sp.]|nr:SRPBCC domain-containing protein [Williamsia sp.]
MSDKNFQTQFVVSQSPAEVFQAINNVRGWWSENIAGSTDQLNAVFLYQYKDVHRCKIRITEFIPEKKVVWHVLENRFSFTKDKGEWVGNELVFDIARAGAETELTFTQIGLVPAYECYEVCCDAWTSYINGSLKELIQTGKGKPNTQEHNLNQELVEKWGLPDK